MTAAALPPGPRPFPLLGNFLDFIREGPEVFLRYSREFGDAVTIHAGRERIFLLSAPEAVRDVLVKNHRNFAKGRALGLVQRNMGAGLLTGDGASYVNARRIIQPSFHKNRLPELAAATVGALAALHQHWSAGSTIDATTEMSELLLRTNAQFFLGIDIADRARRLAEIFHKALAVLNTLNVLPPVIQRLPTPGNLRLRRLCAELHEVAEEIIGDRRRSTGKSVDSLSLMLLSQATADGLSDAEIADQIVTLLFAGFEAPSHALSWAWYLLARNRGAEEQLHQEVDQLLRGREPQLDDLPALRFARSVISEAMRLYPPVWMIARKILEPYPLDTYTLPAGAEIFMSPYIIQRDPRNFGDPLAFNPARWLDVAEQEVPKFHYFPFGGGPRGCMGEHFAWMEMILSLASIAQRWELHLEHEGEIKPNPALTFGPSAPIRMILRERH
jgi:cytochrome P450